MTNKARRTFSKELRNYTELHNPLLTTPRIVCHSGLLARRPSGGSGRNDSQRSRYDSIPRLASRIFLCLKKDSRLGESLGRPDLPKAFGIAGMTGTIIYNVKYRFLLFAGMAIIEIEVTINDLN